MKNKMSIKNKLQRSAIAGLAALAVGGCGPDIKNDSSTILHEKGVVVDVVYSPSKHGSGAGPTIDFNGNIGIAFTSVTVPERYAVVFKCEHGEKFIVQGKTQEYKDLWQRFVEGDSVDISYKELYRSTYEDTNDDGEKELVKRELIDYDFLDAQKLNP